MTKKLAVILVCVLTLSLLSVTAFADGGPKAYTAVYFDGFSGGYYATLLVGKGVPRYDADYIPELDVRFSYAAEKRMYDYAIQNGDFRYYNHCYALKDNDHLLWGSDPPQNFLVVVYFPQYDVLAVSDECSTYAFESYYTASIDVNDLSQHKGQTIHLNVREHYNFGVSFASLLVRMALTVLIEIGIARIFKITEKRQRRFLIILNVATQLFLNILLNISVGTVGMLLTLMIVYAVLEIQIFGIEAAMCGLFINRFSDNGAVISLPKLLLFTLVANTASLLAGLPLMVADGFILALV